jgi:hypothetical protein
MNKVSIGKFIPSRITELARTCRPSGEKFTNFKVCCIIGPYLSCLIQKSLIKCFQKIYILHMETIATHKYSLKQIFKDNWPSFLKAYPSLVTWYMAYNVWKIINCREPDGLGFKTFACPIHHDQVCHVPNS